MQVNKGVLLNYQRNVFHARKTFSMDVGASLGYWKSNKKTEEFFTASLYPVLRLTAVRRKTFDMYLYYSVAGPTYISKYIIDDKQTGKHFTFYDFMGLGLFTGKKRNIVTQLSIGHYSNGNIFPDNAGVKIPLTLNVGYTF